MFLKEMIKNNMLKSTHTSDNASVYEHDKIGKVCFVNDMYMTQKGNIYESEMLAGISYFTQDFMISQDSPKNALLFNSMNLDLAQVLLNLGAKVGMVQSDNDSLDFLGKHFFTQNDIYDNENFSKVANIIDLPFVKYNMIIAQQGLIHHQLDGISRLLEKDGILIYKNKNPFTNLEGFKKSIAEAGDFFEIVMPFSLGYTLGSDNHYIFASKKYHPLSDMRLHAIDMIDENKIKFYNAKMHISAFAMPEFLKQNLKQVAKN